MKTMPSNIMTVAKSGMQPAVQSGKQQTIVITKPTVVGRPATQQIIVVTTASGLRTVQAISTSQAGQGMCLHHGICIKFEIALCYY